MLCHDTLDHPDHHCMLDLDDIGKEKSDDEGHQRVLASVDNPTHIDGHHDDGWLRKDDGAIATDREAWVTEIKH